MKDTKSLLMVLGLFLGIFLAGALAVSNGGHATPATYALFFGGAVAFTVGAFMPNKSAND